MSDAFEVTEAEAVEAGRAMHGWARDLWPIARSLTGPGVRRTLAYLGELLPGLRVHEIASGERVLDWEIPDEWRIRDAYIEGPDGRRFAEFARNNLHVVGYSEPVDEVVSLDELQGHLYSDPENPSWVPYVTSYYKRRWGFCLAHEEREALEPGPYRVVIDADLKPGSLTYADLVIPGRSKREILLSTYICHPSMANNELSGPVLLAALGRWLMERRDELRYSYRLVFVPETIGAITYLSRHVDALRERVVAGFQLTCVGDERAYSYLASRTGDTLADRVALEVLAERAPDHLSYSYLERGSDERQWCAPGVDLPVCLICRSKFDEYPEYHSSADDLELVTPAGLAGSFDVYTRCIAALERARIPRMTVLGEPQLGKRGLYPSVSGKDQFQAVYTLINVIAYSDGAHRVEDIARRIGSSEQACHAVVDDLERAGVIELI